MNDPAEGQAPTDDGEHDGDRDPGEIETIDILGGEDGPKIRDD